MERQKFDSVWDALKDSPAAAMNMTMRSDLMIALRQRIDDWNVTQAEAARRLKLTQPRLNDLIRGRIEKFSLDTLVALASEAGIVVRLNIEAAA
jgi:predicted XRE-type DNA-binding protein